jgi:hypothetical protein
MSHAGKGGQAPDQASSGRQTGAAAHERTDHSQGTHEAASHPTSHARHGDNQAGDGPRQTNTTSLTVPRATAPKEGFLPLVSRSTVASWWEYDRV